MGLKVRFTKPSKRGKEGLFDIMDCMDLPFFKKEVELKIVLKSVFLKRVLGENRLTQKFIKTAPFNSLISMGQFL